VYQIHADGYTYTNNLYYSAEIEYFGREHLPYAILAIVVLCALVILPITILALYPFAFFQKFLNLFPVRWYVLHTFVDSFQGCYKDGTELGTRDYRWFSVVYLLCRIVFLIIYSQTLNVLSFAYVAVLLMGIVVSIVVLKPFKKDQHNLINASFLQLYMCVCVCSLCVYFSQLTMYRAAGHFVLILFGASCFPLLYALLVLAYWLFSRRHLLSQRIHKMRASGHGYAELPGEGRDCLPDRILHPEDYPRNNLTSFVSQGN
jgi:hypothetical protein